MPPAVAVGLFWISVACCLVAQALIVRSVLAARRLPAVHPDLPRANGGVEVLWSVVPGVALALLLVFTWRAMETRAGRASAPPVEAPALQTPTQEAVR
jgi:heme/copper-type cytochrome/quinol oxidase subunit 2